MTGKERFLNACKILAVDRPPIWLMRQAGRYLPEYQSLRAKWDFKDLIRNPELAAEVTVQPIRRFGFDAAIIFSDILVVPQAMGIDYNLEEGRGVVLNKNVRTELDIRKLELDKITEKLSYVADVIKLVKDKLKNQVAIIGFCGGVWTVAAFLIEGGSSKGFLNAVKWARFNRTLYQTLATTLLEALTQFALLQINAGIDAFQIFDTLVGLLPLDMVEEYALSWDERLLRQLNKKVPTILFAKDINDRWARLAQTGADVLGISSSVSLRELSRQLPQTIGLQGNLQPSILLGTSYQVQKTAQRLLRDMSDRKGFIFNLGHGVPPNAKLENIQVLVDTVKNWPEDEINIRS